MASIFWDSEGILLIDFKERNTIVNAQYYAIILHLLRDAIKQKRRGKLTRDVWLYPGKTFVYRNSFRNNQNSYESLRYLYPSQCESIRKTFWISFVVKRLKINPTQSDSIRDFYPNESEVNFQSKWLKTNLDTDWFSIQMNQCSDSDRRFGLSRINFRVHIRLQATTSLLKEPVQEKLPWVKQHRILLRFLQRSLCRNNFHNKPV